MSLLILSSLNNVFYFKMFQFRMNQLHTTVDLFFLSNCQPGKRVHSWQTNNSIFELLIIRFRITVNKFYVAQYREIPTCLRKTNQQKRNIKIAKGIIYSAESIYEQRWILFIIIMFYGYKGNNDSNACIYCKKITIITKFSRHVTYRHSAK